MAMRKSLGHLLNRGFGAWLEMAIERKELLQKTREGLSTMVNRKLALGFDRLTPAIAPRGDHMSKALEHVIDRGLSRGWMPWSEMAMERKAILQKLRKGVEKMVDRKLALGWRAWSKVALWGAWAEMAIERADISRKLHKGLWKGWRAWLSMNKEQKTKHDSMRKSLGHFLNRGLRRGFSAWLEMAIERAKLLQKLGKGLRRMTTRKLALGINAWRAAIVPRDDPMSKALLYFMTRVIVRGWVGWYKAWVELKAKRECLHKSRGYLFQRGFSLGWGAWSQKLEERAAFLRLLSKGVRFKLDRRLAFGLVSWAQATYRTLRQTEGSGHTSRGCLHFKHRHLARGWTAWHAKWADGVAARMAMRKSLGHLLIRCLVRGFGVWLELAIERKMCLEKIGKGLSQTTSRKLRSGVDKWRAAIGTCVDLTVKALSYSINRMLALGWNAWFSTWEEGANKRAAQHRGVIHMLNRGLSRGWSAWLKMAVERGEIIRKLPKGLSFVINRKMALGFSGWQSAIILQQMRETQQGQKTKALLNLMNKAALLHLMNRELSRSWSAWYLALPALKAKRDVISKSLSHLRHRGLSPGFGAWLKISRTRAEVFRMLCKGLSRTTSRKLALGFDRWVAACARRDDLMSKALSYSINRKLALGWNTWFSTWEEVWFSTLKLALGWNAWLITWEEGSLKRAALQRGLSHIHHRMFLRGWGAWVEMAVERAEFARKLHVGLLAAWAKGLSFMIDRKVALGFAGWLSAIAHKKQMREAQQGHMTKAVLHLMNRELSRGWTTWYTTWEEELKGKRVPARRLDPLQEAYLHAAMLHALAEAEAEAEEEAVAEAEEEGLIDELWN